MESQVQLHTCASSSSSSSSRCPSSDACASSSSSSSSTCTSSLQSGMACNLHDLPPPSVLEVNRDITRLANLRTILAYERTTVAVALLALLFSRTFLGETLGLIFGMVLFCLSAVLAIYGHTRFWRTHLTISEGEVLPAPVRASSHRHSQGCHFCACLSRIFCRCKRPEKAMDRESSMRQLEELGKFEDSSLFDGESNPPASGIGMNSHELALLRTQLANVRTTLAFLRTCSTAVALGLSISGALLGIWAYIVCYSFASFLIVMAAYQSRKHQRIIDTDPGNFRFSVIHFSLRHGPHFFFLFLLSFIFFLSFFVVIHFFASL